jgi:hypothetical protein
MLRPKNNLARLVSHDKSWRKRVANVRSSLAVTGLVVLNQSAQAQQGVQNWATGEGTLPTQNQQLQNYTIKSGDFRLLATPSVEFDWNDNVNAVKDGGQKDVIVKPLVQFTGSYPLTEQNILNFNLGIGYNEYLKHSEYSSLNIQSGSQLSFVSHIKDFTIEVHDRVQFQQNSSSEPGVAGTALYGDFDNIAGISATWQLRNIVLTLGIDHETYLSSSSQFNYLNHSSELPLARAGYKFGPALTVGVEGTASFTTYDQQVLNNNSSYSGGIYANWNLGAYFTASAHFGYLIYDFSDTSQSGQIAEFDSSGNPIIVPGGSSPIRTSNLNSWYADLTLSHAISKILTYQLSVGDSTQPGIQADAERDIYVRPSVQLAIIKDVSLQCTVSYDHGQEGLGNIQGNLTSTFDYINTGLALGYAITKKLSLSLNYGFTLRAADPSPGSYVQNTTGLQVSYHLE